MANKSIQARNDSKFVKFAADLRNKKRWTMEEATVVIQVLKQSGLSRYAFGRQYELPHHRLKYWSDKISLGSGQAGKSQNSVLTLQPIRLSSQVIECQPLIKADSEQIEVVTPYGWVIRLGPDFKDVAFRRVLEVVPC